MYEERTIYVNTPYRATRVPSGFAFPRDLRDWQISHQTCVYVCCLLTDNLLLFVDIYPRLQLLIIDTEHKGKAEMAIQRLPKSVSATIVSTSSLQSQTAILKELIENAIDAIGSNNNANSHILVEIDKDSAGLEYLAVTDNGIGVRKSDRNIMCLNYTTSKLHSLDELTNGVSTCGFRGEALNLIARLSKLMTISTKTSEDKTVETWVVNNSGLPVGTPKHASGLGGTTIKLSGLFKSTPVRHKFLTERKHKLTKEMEALLITYALVYRNIRFQLRYVKSLPKGKILNGDTKTFNNKITQSQFICELLDIRKKGWLETGHMSFTVDNGLAGSYSVEVEFVLPKMRAQDVLSYKHGLKVLSVNNRPMNLSLSFGKNIANKINEAYAENILLAPPVWYLAMRIPTDRIDVNIEPEKSDIITAGETILLTRFKSDLCRTLQAMHGLDETQSVVESHPSRKENEADTSHTVKSSNVPPISLSELEERLMSDDESFIEELNSTVKEIQKRYIEGIESVSCEHSIKKGTRCDRDLSSKEDISLNELNQTHDAPEPPQSSDENINAAGDDGVEQDNEWSRTVYDTTEVSSELDLPMPNSADTQNDTRGMDSSHISISNPWTIAQLSNQIHDATNDIDETLVGGEPALGDKRLHTSTQNQDEGLQHKPLKRKHNTKRMSEEASACKSRLSTKQTTLESFDVTISEKPSSAEKLTRFVMPIVSECSQNSIHQKIQTDFVYSLTKAHRNKQAQDDETWVHRSGIPSIDVVTGALELYQSVSHPLETPIPVYDPSHKIYKLA